jgi:ABC-type Fe3+ transport system substrate-binding protein
MGAERFTEGAPITIGGGTVNLVDSAPHPNAAKVFINWLLSREGQIAFQDAIRLPSLRRDTPKSAFADISVPKPGGKYVDGGAEAFARVSIAEVVDIVNAAAG